MSGATYRYGVMHKRGLAPEADLTRGPRDFHGLPGAGRIARLFVGQGHGYIRLTNAREVFFHRADVKDDTRFNDLRLGDAVSFELFEDAVSGARALRVTLRTRRR